MDGRCCAQHDRRHRTNDIVIRRWTSVFALLMMVAGGCREQGDFPSDAKRTEPSKESATTPTEYRTQWLGPQTVTVAPGVHVFGELFPSAVYAVETTEGVILIDSGGNENATEVREYMTAVGLRVEQIRYILITHAHYDHVFGANKLREMSNAVVCAGREDCGTLRAADQDALFSIFSRHEVSGAPIEVDRELQDGDTIELGDVKITAIGTPGHTPGSTCYLLEKDSQRILFSGDVIASLSLGPATYPVHISPRYRGDAESYLQTIDRLLAMEPPDLLLPGHPLQQTRPYSIRMDEPLWNSLLQPAQAELEQAARRQSQDGKDFLDGVAKEIEPGLYYLGEFGGMAVYCIAHDQQMIVINAPGGDGFAKFLSTQFEALGLPPQEPAVVLLTSSDYHSRSGLSSLATPPLVVAPEPALNTLLERGVENAMSHKDLAAIATFPIQTIQIDETLSYVFSLGTKQVLVTPAVPRNVMLVWTNRQTGHKKSSVMQPQTDQLLAALSGSPAAANMYQESLRQLRKFSPDIWLPALTLMGQNANLYDDQWQRIVDDNLELVARFGSPAE